jgi:hypothetical protein
MGSRDFEVAGLEEAREIDQSERLELRIRYNGNKKDEVFVELE